VIVRTFPDRLELITQPDHAHLARTIMERCAPLDTRPRRAAILHAIEQHDNGWTEPDAAPMVDPATGAVLDFINVPLEVRHAVWPRGIGRLAGDPWAAALVAQHALAVYDRFRSDPGWTPFFAGLEVTRDALLKTSGLPLEALADDYPLLRLADLISLAFCTASPIEQRIAGWTVAWSGTGVSVEPDAFGGAAIPIAIVARQIPRTTFRSDADLRDELAAAATTTVRGTVAASR
jgi:uncharacterized protein DUF3891